jgi:hypothetical protein
MVELQPKMITLGEVTVPVNFEMTDAARDLLRLEVKKLMLELLNENNAMVAEFVRGIVRDELAIDRTNQVVQVGMHKGKVR